MNILVVMIPLSIVLLVGAGIAFFWAVEHDQFDDLDTPGILPLLDAPPAADAAQDPRRCAATPPPEGGAGASSARWSRGGRRPQR